VYKKLVQVYCTSFLYQILIQVPCEFLSLAVGGPVHAAACTTSLVSTFCSLEMEVSSLREQLSEKIQLVEVMKLELETFKRAASKAHCMLPSTVSYHTIWKSNQNRFLYTRLRIIIEPPWFLLYSLWTKRQKLTKLSRNVWWTMLFISNNNNNILNYWLGLCSKCLLFALTHARRRVRHWLTAISITCWSSSSQAVRIRECSSSTSLIRPLATLRHACSIISCLVLSRGNFYAEKQHSNEVLPFGASPVGLIMTHRVL